VNDEKMRDDTMRDEKVRTAYRATLVVALKEAQARGDKAAQQRIKLMIDLHDKDIPAPKLDGKGKGPRQG
jgi:hypothetical protein